MGGGPQFPTEYRLTFTQAGTYDYNCLFHTTMTGTVVVQDAGSAYPKTQDQIDAEAQAQIAADTQAAMKAETQAQQVTSQPGPNGTTTYAVNMGWGDGTMAYLRFAPQDLTIHAGDTVEWTNRDVEAPHTVTFTSGDPVPEFVLTEPQQSGPPKLVLNPKVAAPAGSDTYSGSGYVNSGVIWGTEVPIPGPRTYSLIFDTPGTYDYVCVIHDEVGMVGTITVLAAGAQSGAASSGAASQPAATSQTAPPSQLPVTGGSGTSVSPWWLILVGVAVLGAGVALITVGRHRSTTG
jgi:plastocyanin